MSKTTFGLNALVTVFKKQIEIESTSDNLKRFEFNKGKAVTFDKAAVLEGFAAHEIKLSDKVIKAIPEETKLQHLLYDAGTGEIDIEVELIFDKDFVTNKYNEIISLDSIGLSLRRTAEGDVKDAVIEQ
jgi:hypothetical protein